MPVTIGRLICLQRFLSGQIVCLVRSRIRILSYLTLSFGFCFPTAMASSAAPSNKSFEYKDAVEEARLLSQKPFEEPKKIPEFLSKISYDQWRSIRFKPEKALWREDKLPFEAEFFHPGFLYNRTVSINVVESDEIRPIPFSRDLFHYGMNEFKEKVPEDLGFAGFRLHYPINTSKYFDEVVVFLGASYFRAVASNEHFGLSARGLAVDTAMESGEEFPFFKKFWLVHPQKKAESITIFALLDSPSLTGAYQFGIQPGKATLIDVASTLFLRKEVKKLGVAPLNSMFFYGENINIRPVDDFRPEVHDSDGLQIATATGEWIWRPLINPKRLLVTSFKLSKPKGFCLFQRDRDFDHYQDLGSNYQMRPCAWVIPKSDWGEGRVELAQIPTDSDKNDNIVAYWVPANPPKPGSPASFSYQMKWGGPEIAEPPLACVVATRTATSGQKAGKMYLIDFEGDKLRSLPENAKVEAEIGAGGGEIVERHIQKATVFGGWRLVFHVKQNQGPLDRVTGGNPPLELRAFLRQGDEVLTETWSYVDPF